jgi:hypothetical protein
MPSKLDIWETGTETQSSVFKDPLSFQYNLFDFSINSSFLLKTIRIIQIQGMDKE